ncbi:aromatic ring-hydroxylating oxygenase subunit alpha [Acetobacter fallax]|uniref:Aromatic ring-hydroxylating dioxygenase subunit alpha n=1 Tax=Acetobacter fallax TaxID=1737473 RepID=A0ABX0KEQ1_9PROT|nr:aromatic ring-hydroxylating dioxygenase subunit alpha [Acetobacter fallax]NHO33581.1 aromatic ring-hydroxylating dioxygenase subunit alpha [Acetobacter fallax]NHO37173.1 aromatic ring-hydroxylating dioxygenase subunit alpha [Acetobacter fallax]
MQTVSAERECRPAIDDRAVLDQWYPVAFLETLKTGETTTRLLGSDLRITRAGDGALTVHTTDGQPLPVREAHTCLWTTPGTPKGDVVSIPEAHEPDRRIVPCGAIHVRTSGLRVVENFLDMAHFPFVHTNILGAEPVTEVVQYRTEHRKDVDEIWATDCRFDQPQAAKSAAVGMMTEYTYRVAAPFLTLLYKSSPNDPVRPDVICLFVQPVGPAYSIAYPVMFLIDDVTPFAELAQFQQRIFVQDRIILENQRPALLPLAPRAEIPTRADSLSVAYRRWLKAGNLRYGAIP